MSVAVYSRLGQLLLDKKMSVRDLAREITTRFGVEVDERALTRLTEATRVRRPDLELAGAAAAVLDAELGDVFAVEIVPLADNGDPAPEEDTSVLAPARSRRLRELYRWQGRRALTDDEWAEMDALVALYGRLLHEQGVREIAATRHLPVEQARADLEADLDRIVAWRRELDADPARKEALVQEAQARQRARAVG